MAIDTLEHTSESAATTQSAEQREQSDDIAEFLRRDYKRRYDEHRRMVEEEGLNISVDYAGLR